MSIHQKLFALFLFVCLPLALPQSLSAHGPEKTNRSLQTISTSQPKAEEDSAVPHENSGREDAPKTPGGMILFFWLAIYVAWRVRDAAPSESKA